MLQIGVGTRFLFPNAGFAESAGARQSTDGRSMTNYPETHWHSLGRNVRNRLISGMVVLVPAGITLLVMQWLIQWMAGFLEPFVEWLAFRLTTALDMAHIPEQTFKFPVMIVSILGFLMIVYLTGALAQVVIGRRLIQAAETVLMRVPLASTVYSAAKQVMEAIAMPTRSGMRTAVLVEFPRRGAWSIGFLTGKLVETESQGMLKVFVPTTPNPTTGFFLVVPHEDVLQTDLTVEEAFKMIISAGIVAPTALEKRQFVPGATCTDELRDA
jgi:uncharacterized membrane protein